MKKKNNTKSISKSLSSSSRLSSCSDMKDIYCLITNKSFNSGVSYKTSQFIFLGAFGKTCINIVIFKTNVKDRESLSKKEKKKGKKQHLIITVPSCIYFS